MLTVTYARSSCPSTPASATSPASSLSTPSVSTFIRTFFCDDLLHALLHVHCGHYHARDQRQLRHMFQRNVMFWKTLALTHLGTTYLKNFEFDLISLAMIICGYGLSTAATVALGIDQTYFGWSSAVEPNFVHGFPYDVVPHPMIIGSMVGLLGFHKMAGFRAALPYAIPMHCTMYFIHMVQEQINDIYAANWKEMTPKTRKRPRIVRPCASLRASRRRERLVEHRRRRRLLPLALQRERRRRRRRRERRLSLRVSTHERRGVSSPFLNSHINEKYYIAKSNLLLVQHVRLDVDRVQRIDIA